LNLSWFLGILYRLELQVDSTNHEGEEKAWIPTPALVPVETITVVSLFRLSLMSKDAVLFKEFAEVLVGFVIRNACTEYKKEVQPNGV
jgi:hypothetical protein